MRYLIPLLFLFSTANAEFNIELGAAHLSGSNSNGAVVIFQERYDKWLVGIGFIDEQEVCPSWEMKYNYPCPVFVDRNLFLHGQRLLKWKGIELGVGAAYFQNTNRALGKNFTVSASIGYHLNKHVWVGARHFSNAGSGTPNLGQDMLNIGITF